MPSDRYPSLALVFEELKAVLDRQTTHVDALDSKASIVIGFTAVVLGITARQGPEIAEPLLIAGVGLATVAFLVAIRAFWVRPYATFPIPREFLQEFAGADEEQTQLVLCNLAVSVIEQNTRSVIDKARALKIALGALVGSVCAFVLSFVLKGAV